MCIQMNLENHITSLNIKGDIYLEHAEVLRAIIDDRTHCGCNTINLNMADVYYIDCQGLQVLANLQHKLRHQGITLQFEQARDWENRLALCFLCSNKKH